MKKIYIIAAEPSGDILGGHILDAISNNNFLLKGVGGDKIESFGIKSLFSIKETSVVGILEVIPKIFKIAKRINETVNDVIKFSPDILITIDSPDFCGRVIDKLKKYQNTEKNKKKIHFIHYVAPSVWAWREKRAKIWADRVDNLLCLWDFEQKYFTQYNLKTTFVGHPTINKIKPIGLKKEPICLILPGSRVSEVKRHVKIFYKAFKKLKEQNPELKAVIPTFPGLKKFIDISDKDLIIDCNQENRFTWFEKASFAIAASGTVTLELFNFKVKTVVAYKVPHLTYLIVKNLIKIPYTALPNIILEEKIIPECIQNDCTAENIKKSFDYEICEDKFKKFKTLTTPPKDWNILINDLINDLINKEIDNFK